MPVANIGFAYEVQLCIVKHKHDKMKHIIEKEFGNVKVIERSDYKWGVLDKNGNEIVPFGKYDWISGFDNGLVRVKIGKLSSFVKNDNKWGIINEQGSEVLPVEYDEVWNFYGKNRTTTRVFKGGRPKDISLKHLRDGNDNSEENHNGYYSFERRHYIDFVGSYAQDMAGYSWI